MQFSDLLDVGRCVNAHYRVKKLQPKKKLTDVIFLVGIVSIHQLEQANFDLRLIEEGFLIFYDFDGDGGLIDEVVGANHLTERPLANKGFDFVSEKCKSFTSIQ